MLKFLMVPVAVTLLVVGIAAVSMSGSDAGGPEPESVGVGGARPDLILPWGTSLIDPNQPAQTPLPQ